MVDRRQSKQKPTGKSNKRTSQQTGDSGPSQQRKVRRGAATESPGNVSQTNDGMPPLHKNRETASAGNSPVLTNGVREIMHPPHNTSPSPAEVSPFPTNQHMQSLLEINEQETANKKTCDSVDLKSKISNRINLVIWARTKFPDFDSTAGENLKKYLQKSLGLSDVQFSNRWKFIRTTTTAVLRSKRSYHVQLMKGNYFGEFFVSSFLLRHGQCYLEFLTASILLPVCTRLA